MSSRRQFLAALGIALAPILGPAAGGVALAAGDLTAGALPARKNIVATIAMIGDALRNIGGTDFSITTLIGESVDPHSYRQTRADVITLGGAQAIFANGLYLEAQLEDLLKTLSGKIPVSFLGELAGSGDLIEHAGYSGRFDPHIWMSPLLWRKYMPHLARQLAQLAPDRRAVFDANAADYATLLAALSDYMFEVVETIPPAQRVLITAHDAFGYFGRDYGLAVEGIQGLSTQSEAGLNRMAVLVDMIVERRIPAIFVESSVSQRNVLALVEGARQRGAKVRIGGSLYSDSMGPPGTYEGSYIGMIDHNVTQVTRALGGNAPARGWQGKLGDA